LTFIDDRKHYGDISKSEQRGVAILTGAFWEG
jgi:hypothetical protein